MSSRRDPPRTPSSAEPDAAVSETLAGVVPVQLDGQRGPGREEAKTKHARPLLGTVFAQTYRLDRVIGEGKCSAMISEVVHIGA